MKNYLRTVQKLIPILFVLIMKVTFLTAQQVTTNSDCNELFISEITFNKQLIATNNLQLNYAVEIYNPTNSNIDLSQYKVIVEQKNGVNINIPLNTYNINPYSTFIVSNTNSDVQLSSIADILSQDFRLDNGICLKLYNGYNVIDQVGESAISTLSFDFAAYINDPINYLLNFDINLDDINSFGLKRDFFVSKGKTNFETIDLNSEWRYVLNADWTDVGSHNSICSPQSGSTVTFDNNAYEVQKCCGLNKFQQEVFLNNTGNGNIKFKVFAVSNTSSGGWSAVLRVQHDVTNSTCVSKDEGPNLFAGTSSSTLLYNSADWFWGYGSSNTGFFLSTSDNHVEDNYNLPPSKLNQLTTVVGPRCNSYENCNQSCVSSLDLSLGTNNSASVNTTASGTLQFKITKVDCNSTSIRDNYFNHLNLYPTVSSQYFYIDMIEQGKLSVMDLNGAILKLIKLEEGTNKIDISELPKGVYIISYSNARKTNIEKVIKL
jgi:hypothetical protein